MKAYQFLGLLLFTSQSLFSQFGNTAQFNGVNDYFEAPENSSIDFTDEMTLEAWIYVACDADDYRAVVNKQWCQGQDFAYALGVRNGDLEWTWLGGPVISCAAPNTYRSSNVIPDNEWIHVAVTHTPSNIELYVNGLAISGSLINGNFSSIINSSQPLKIGVYRPQNGILDRYFHGAMDEIRLWDSTRTAAEIADNFDAPLMGNEANLISYYNMDLSTAGVGILLPNQAMATGVTNDALAEGGTTNSPYFLNAEDNLSFLNGGFSTFNVEICEGDSYFAEGAEQSTTGIYTDIIDLGDCDSMVITNLTVIEDINVLIEVVDCNEVSGIYELELSFTGGLPELDPTIPYLSSGGFSDNTFIGEHYTLFTNEGEFFTINATDGLCTSTASVELSNCSKTNVEWYAFDALITQKGNELIWITASETRSDYFNVQHSTDGFNFQNIAKVKATGNSNIKQTYVFIDSQNTEYPCFYRIEEKDQYGQTNWSNAIVLHYYPHKNNDFKLTISPNPAQEFITIQTDIPENELIHLRIINVKGQEVLKKQASLSDIQALDIAHLSNGLYYLELTNLMSEKAFMKFVKK